MENSDIIFVIFIVPLVFVLVVFVLLACLCRMFTNKCGSRADWTSLMSGKNVLSSGSAILSGNKGIFYYCY